MNINALQIKKKKESIFFIKFAEILIKVDNFLGYDQRVNTNRNPIHYYIGTKRVNLPKTNQRTLISKSMAAERETKWE